MRIVFFGTPDWAVPSVEALARSSHELLFIVTQPAKRRGRGREPSPTPVASTAARLGIPVIEPESVKTPETLAQIAAQAPDLFAVVAYGKIFPRALLALPRAGSINLHFSLLPRYRGAAPVQWALAEGETHSGVTSMRMVQELDAGPIYLQERVAIGPDEHAPQLGARLAGIGARVLVETIDGLASGNLQAREQDPAQATFARMMTAADGWIDWSLSAQRIAMRVRGFDPWPGQSAQSRKGKVRIVEARPCPESADPSAPAGLVAGEGAGSVRVVCGSGSILEALVVQPEGRRPMSGSEALRGRQLFAGERLGAPDAAQR